MRLRWLVAVSQIRPSRQHRVVQRGDADDAAVAAGFGRPQAQQSDHIGADIGMERQPGARPVAAAAVQVVEIATVVTLEEALDEPPNFTSSRGIQFFASIDESIPHSGLETQDQLSVLLRFLFLLAIFPGHSFPQFPGGRC